MKASDYYLDIDKVSKLQFEDEKYNCPQEYKEILKMEYGDYMTPPPEKERQGLHYMNCYE